MARAGLPRDILKPQDMLLLTAHEKRDAEKWESERRAALGARSWAIQWRSRLQDPLDKKEDLLKRKDVPSLDEVARRISVAEKAEAEAEKALRQFVMLAESRRQSKVNN